MPRRWSTTWSELHRRRASPGEWGYRDERAAHFDAQVLSALGRLHRGGPPQRTRSEERIALTAQAPFQRHLLGPLLERAWALHHNVRLVDALYIELANQLDATILTTDAGMASAAPNAELIE